MKSLILLVTFCLSFIHAENDLKVVRFNNAREAWLAGDREKTLAILIQNETAGDMSPANLYNIGFLYFLKGDFTKALVYLQTVIVRQPEFAYSYLQIARIHRQIGNLHAAHDHLEKGLKKDAENIDLLLEMAEVCAALKDTETAIKSYEEIIDRNNGNSQAITGLTAIYREQRNYRMAEKILQENSTIYPEALLLHEKAKLAAAQGRSEERKKYLMQIINDYPHSEKWQGMRDTLEIDYKLMEIPVDTIQPAYSYKIDPREELDYKVTYGPMTLGWLKIRISPKEKIGDKDVYPVLFFVDTNSSYGFILSLHHIYESYIDPITMNAYKSRLFTPGSENNLVKTYYYDYDRNLFKAYLINEEGYFNYLQKDLPRKVQDGTSMLYFARGLVSDKKSGVTTVVIDEEYKYGTVDFLNKTEKLESAGSPVDALKIFARAEFKGVAGMNGDAWGWFSIDKNSVPLKGSIEIVVGSITVEIDKDKTEISDYHEEFRK